MLVRFLVFALGLILGLGLGRCPAERGGGPGVVEVKPGKVGPREVLDHDRPMDGLIDRLRQREVTPEGVYETLERSEVGDQVAGDRLAGAEQPQLRRDSADHGVNTTQQITYRDGVLSIFVHDASKLREYQFRVRPSFDAIMPSSGPPRVFEDRCWVCEFRAQVELAGALYISSGAAGPERLLTLPAPRPYLSADLSAGVLSPRTRLFARPEITIGGEKRVLFGARIVF